MTHVQRILFILGAAIFSIVLSYGLVTWFDLGQPAQETPQVLETTQPESRSALVDDLLAGSAMFQVLERDFPQAFEDLVRTIERTAPEGTEAVQIAVADAVSGIRMANAPLLLAASSPELERVVLENIATHELIRNEGGEVACGAFGVDGPAALGLLAVDPSIMAQLDRQGATLFEAIASGRDNEPREPANDSVWTSVVGYDSLNQHEQRLLELFGRQDASEPGYCEALIWFLRQLAASEGKDADRARAAFAMQLASS